MSAIIYVIKYSLGWKDAPKGYSPHKTLYNCFIRWSQLGVFDRIFLTLAAQSAKPEYIMDKMLLTLKLIARAASLLKKGLFHDGSGEQKVV